MTLKKITLFIVIVIVSVASFHVFAEQEVMHKSPQVTLIADDLAIVTELSHYSPFQGQQFSILYKLRAYNPPSAVDINPQQFPGFWTFVSPVPPNTKPTTLLWEGKPAKEYLLRELIAYPLSIGPNLLPPLSLKIKRVARNAANLDDWDLLAESDTIGLDVRELPGNTRYRLPFVGDIKGSLRQADDTSSSLAILEIEGTANLSFFRPADWLALPEGLTLKATISSADNSMQIRDVGGTRNLVLIQRQQWSLRLYPSGENEVQIKDLLIPVYKAAENEWKDVRIPGVKIKLLSQSQKLGKQGPLGAEQPSSSARVMSGAVGMGLFVCLIIGVAVGIWLRKRWLRGTTDGMGKIGLLEKKLQTSSKAFIEGAHKYLEKTAKRRGRRHDLGRRDETLDKCWTQVELHRFKVQGPSRESCLDILGLIREVADEELKVVKE